VRKNRSQKGVGRGGGKRAQRVWEKGGVLAPGGKRVDTGHNCALEKKKVRGKDGGGNLANKKVTEREGRTVGTKISGRTIKKKEKKEELSRGIEKGLP